MECFEHGLIGLDDTGGVELRFGNAEAMVRCVETDRRGASTLATYWPREPSAHPR